MDALSPVATATYQALLLWQALPGCGPKRWQQAAQRWPDWPTPLLTSQPACLQWLPATARERWSSIQQQTEQQWQRLQDWLAASPLHSVLSQDDPLYPPLLAEVEGAPLLLYVKGRAAALALPQVALVGSRHASVQGLHTAHSFARELTRQGLSVTSGLALGIDTAAHQGALKGSSNQDATTIAVLGTGIDRLYPVRNQALAEQILAAGGALVSELPLGTGPLAGNFPKRNRLISGLSAAVIVVEAALKSGSLSTASHALGQNRPLFAVPGSIHQPQSRGCHALIRQGAILLEEIEQVLQELAPLLGHQRQVLQQRLQQYGTDAQTEEEATQPLWRVLDELPRSPDELAALSGQPLHEVLSQLLEWELLGRVVQAPGGYVRDPAYGAGRAS
ncbi:DNA-processing protein DprA [Balneatrix alpica]|uniref:DNA-processing protein DprA n=1 Tax=Balneatrix alpica TaxID=75684 RepID=UPI002738E6BB|nr:DNA-processing protein DprA [Balneatrix alpica]